MDSDEREECGDAPPPLPIRPITGRHRAAEPEHVMPVDESQLATILAHLEGLGKH